MRVRALLALALICGCVTASLPAQSAIAAPCGPSSGGKGGGGGGGGKGGHSHKGGGHGPKWNIGIGLSIGVGPGAGGGPHFTWTLGGSGTGWKGSIGTGGGGGGKGSQGSGPTQGGPPGGGPIPSGSQQGGGGGPLGPAFWSALGESLQQSNQQAYTAPASAPSTGNPYVQLSAGPAAAPQQAVLLAATGPAATSLTATTSVVLVLLSEGTGHYWRLDPSSRSFQGPFMAGLKTVGAGRRTLSYWAPSTADPATQALPWEQGFVSQVTVLSPTRIGLPTDFTTDAAGLSLAGRGTAPVLWGAPFAQASGSSGFDYITGSVAQTMGGTAQVAGGSGTLPLPYVYQESNGQMHLLLRDSSNWAWDGSAGAFTAWPVPGGTGTPGDAAAAARVWVGSDQTAYTSAGGVHLAWNPYLDVWVDAAQPVGWSSWSLGGAVGQVGALRAPWTADVLPAAAGAVVGVLAGLAVAALAPVAVPVAVLAGGLAGAAGGAVWSRSEPTMACGTTGTPDNLPWTTIYAPDIYIYPPRMEQVTVRVGGSATVGASRPAYRGGWSVEASPSGMLTAGGQQMDHLYYEARAAVRWQTARGWVVPAAGWPQWIRSELPRLGLNAREVAEFARDWDHTLPSSPFYLVAPQPQTIVDAGVPLSITPRPANVYRLWLYIQPLRGRVQVLPPHPATLGSRAGLTVVEWGVAFSRGAVPKCAPEWNCPRSG